MSSNFVTFDTLTVGLGEDAGPADPIAQEPPPLLARVPRVRGVRRRLDAPGGTTAATGLSSFEVTTSQPTSVAPQTKRAARRPIESTVATLPVEPPSARPHSEPRRLSSTLLRMQSGRLATNRLVLWAVLAAIAGASLVLIRSDARNVDGLPINADPAPPWTPAPLAGPAPPFIPDTPAFAPIESGVATELRARGPVGVARRAPTRAESNPQPLEGPSPAVPAPRLAGLPSPYPSTGLPPAGSPAPAATAGGSRPSARLTGQVRASGEAVASPAANPSTAPSRYEQNRSGLY